MKYVLMAAVLASTSAVAQTPKAHAPQVGGKPLVQVKPGTPQDCKLVGTVKVPSYGLAIASRSTGKIPSRERSTIL
jgi:hypothetical protein